jgi:hypothetical protein
MAHSLYDRDSSNNFSFTALLKAKERISLGFPVYIMSLLLGDTVNAELVEWSIQGKEVILDLEADGVPFYQALDLQYADALFLHSDGWLYPFHEARIENTPSYF